MIVNKNSTISKSKKAGLGRFMRDQRGAGLMEYTMLAGLVAIAAFAAFRTFGTNVNNAVNDQANQVTQIPTSE